MGCKSRMGFATGCEPEEGSATGCVLEGAGASLVAEQHRPIPSEDFRDVTPNDIASYSLSFNGQTSVMGRYVMSPNGCAGRSFLGRYPTTFPVASVSSCAGHPNPTMPAASTKQKYQVCVPFARTRQDIMWNKINMLHALRVFSTIFLQNQQ